MADQVVPNTENTEVARMALAWAIVHAAVSKKGLSSGDTDKAAQELTAMYIETYNAILANELAQPHPTIRITHEDRPE